MAGFGLRNNIFDNYNYINYIQSLADLFSFPISSDIEVSK